MHGKGESERCSRSDVKPTPIKEKEKKHMSMVYGDVYKSNSNLDLCTNPIGVPVLG